MTGSWRRAVVGAALVSMAGMLTVGCVAPDADRSAPAVAVPPPPPATPTPPARLTLDGTATQGGVVRGVAPAGTVSLALDETPVAFAADGAFLIALDRDAGPAARLVATLRDGRRIAEPLIVAPRGWDVSRLSGLPRYPVPAPEFERLRPAELAQINAARAQGVMSDGWRQQFLWPATGRISTLFGSQRIYRNGEAGAYHSGVDVAKPTGSVVIAPADGIVTLATERPFTLEGYLLLIDHGGGLNSAFMHLSRIDVRLGDRVRRGQPIALVGATGRATGPHLHWGMKWNAARIDPLLLAGPMPGTETARP